MDDQQNPTAPSVVPKQPPTDSWWQKFNKLPQRTKIIVGVIVVGLVGLGIWYFAIFRPSQLTKPAAKVEPWNIGPKFPVNQKVAQVGQETIYGDDLNYKIYINYPKSRNASAAEVSSLKKELLNSIATESAVLQAARDQKIVDVPADILNNPSKNQLQRSQLIQQTRRKVQEGSTTYAYSVISIWFYNMYKPSIPLDQADKLAAAKINSLYQQLVAKKIDMKQAGDLIKADTDLAKLDSNYQGNAYSFRDGLPPGRGSSRFDEINAVAVNLKQGEISQVIKVVKLGREASPDIALPYTSDGHLDTNEQFYAVVKLESIKQGVYPGLGQWTIEAVRKYGGGA